MYQHLRPHHLIAAVVLYALFTSGLDPKLIALVAGLLYLDDRHRPGVYPRTPRPAASRTLLAVRSVPADP